VIVISLIAEVRPFNLILTVLPQTWYFRFLFLSALLAFLFGFCCVYSGKAILGLYLKMEMDPVLLVAVALRYPLFRVPTQSPDYLMATETRFWCFHFCFDITT
jgi:hypothetical protein